MIRLKLLTDEIGARLPQIIQKVRKTLKAQGERYNTRLLTPRDWASHFKNILHRALMVRSTTTGESCRCCNFARENIQHFATCEVASKLWDDLILLAGGEGLRNDKERERFALFALLYRKDSWKASG